MVAFVIAMFALLVIPMLLLAGVVVYALRPVLSRIPPVLKHCRKRSRNLPRKAFDLPPRRGGYGSATVLSVHSAVVAVLGVAAVVSLGAGWAGLGRLKNSATVGHAITRVLLAVATVPVPTVVFVLAALSALRGNGAVPRFLTRGVTHKTLLVVVPAVVALIVVSSAHAFCHIAVGALLAVLGPVLGTLCFIQQPKSHTTSNTSWTDVSESHITAPPRATPRTPERRSERNRLRSSLYSTDSWISSPSQSIASLPEWDFTVPDESSTEPSVGSITTHAVATLNSTARGTPKPMPVASAYVLSSNNKRFSYRRMSCMRKTSSPQWTFSSSAEILADSEWESVSALDGSESWAGGSNVVGGLVAMICVVLCYVSLCCSTDSRGCKCLFSLWDPTPPLWESSLHLSASLLWHWHWSSSWWTIPRRQRVTRYLTLNLSRKSPQYTPWQRRNSSNQPPSSSPDPHSPQASACLKLTRQCRATTTRSPPRSRSPHGAGGPLPLRTSSSPAV